jgi:hypothetical protein
MLAQEADQDRRENYRPDRYGAFQMPQVAVSRQILQEILPLIARLPTPS